MAGHSKWANIKHRKAAQDKKRGKQFAKLIRVIESSAREAGSSDPTGSPSLALAVQKARDADVPKDNIERACRRGAGEDDGGARYESATYEGYAPGGVAVLVDVLTDNRNRTASDVRSLFTRAGGSLAEPGAVSFLFGRRGQVVLDGLPTRTTVLAAGHRGRTRGRGGREDGTTSPGASRPRSRRCVRRSRRPGCRSGAGSTMVANVTVRIEDATEAGRVLRLLDALEDNDDVQEVHANLDVDEAVLADVEL
jgi:transcriptional/translational regulatory protein YebC/TACO1